MGSKRQVDVFEVETVEDNWSRLMGEKPSKYTPGTFCLLLLLLSPSSPSVSFFYFCFLLLLSPSSSSVSFFFSFCLLLLLSPSSSVSFYFCLLLLLSPSSSVSFFCLLLLLLSPSTSVSFFFCLLLLLLLSPSPSSVFFFCLLLLLSPSSSVSSSSFFSLLCSSPFLPPSLLSSLFACVSAPVRWKMLVVAQGQIVLLTNKEPPLVSFCSTRAAPIDVLTAVLITDGLARSFYCNCCKKINK